MKRSLLLKIFVTYLVIIVLSFLVLHLFLRDEIRKMMIGQVEEQIMISAQLVDLNSSQDMLRQIRQIGRISGARVTLVDAEGKVFADSEREIAGLENHLNRSEIQEARVRGKGRSIRFSQSMGEDMLYVAVPVREGETIKGYVRLARPLPDVRRAVDKTYNSFFLALLIVAACSLVIAVIFSWRLAAPIKAMEKFTEGLRSGTPEGSVLIKTSDETKKLADNINYLVEELKNKIRLVDEENSKLTSAFASMAEGVMILDDNDKIETVNRALSHMLSSRYKDIVGKTLLEAFRNVEMQQALLKFKETRELIAQEVVLGEQNPVILSVSITAVKGDVGHRKTMIVLHDVTRLKKLEQMRIDFVANVTHEIRTPLTAILGYLETIRDGAIKQTEQTSKFIETIINHAQRLNRLVDDLLTISKIELGEMSFHFEDVFIHDVLKSVMPLVEQKAKAKNIRIDNMIAADFVSLKADKDRLVQIFVNILDNAVKFTPENGAVKITATKSDEFAVINISDTGVGIPADELARLGERFYRVDKTRSRDMGGTGLGLSIVKHLMMAHGGKINISSQPGHGTEVSLFFPLAR